MENIMCRDKGYKMQTIFSILTLGMFIFLGFASIVEVPPLDCEIHNPPLEKMHVISLDVFDKETHLPLVNLTVKCRIINYERVDNANNCEIKLIESNPKILNTDLLGKAKFTQDKVYFSRADKIELFFDAINENYYPETIFHTLRDYDSNLTIKIELLKKEQYP